MSTVNSKDVNNYVGIDLSLRANLVSGSGPYHNPNDIYSPGHKTYKTYSVGENTIPEVSGIVTNIDLLREGNQLKILQPEDAIRVFDPILLKDYVLAPEHSGLSVKLKFGNSNVITTSNVFKNL